MKSTLLNVKETQYCHFLLHMLFFWIWLLSELFGSISLWVLTHTFIFTIQAAQQWFHCFLFFCLGSFVTIVWAQCFLYSALLFKKKSGVCAVFAVVLALRPCASLTFLISYISDWSHFFSMNLPQSVIFPRRGEINLSFLPLSFPVQLWWALTHICTFDQLCLKCRPLGEHPSRESRLVEEVSNHPIL